MIIYRDGKAIELTALELEQAYREAREQYLFEEICDKLREDYNVEPCTDDYHIDVRQIVWDAMDLLANDDIYWDCEQDAKHQAIKQYLKEWRKK